MRANKLAAVSALSDTDVWAVGDYSAALSRLPGAIPYAAGVRTLARALEWPFMAGRSDAQRRRRREHPARRVGHRNGRRLGGWPTMPTVARPDRKRNPSSSTGRTPGAWCSPPTTPICTAGFVPLARCRLETSTPQAIPCRTSAPAARSDTAPSCTGMVPSGTGWECPSCLLWWPGLHRVAVTPGGHLLLSGSSEGDDSSA